MGAPTGPEGIILTEEEQHLVRLLCRGNGPVIVRLPLGGGDPGESKLKILVGNPGIGAQTNGIGLPGLQRYVAAVDLHTLGGADQTAPGPLGALRSSVEPMVT